MFQCGIHKKYIRYFTYLEAETLLSNPFSKLVIQGAASSSLHVGSTVVSKSFVGKKRKMYGWKEDEMPF